MLDDADKNIELALPGTARTVNLDLPRKRSTTYDTFLFSGKHHRKLRFGLGGLVGIIVVGLYVYYNQPSVRSLRTAHLVQGDASDGHYAEDGSFLAELGPAAEDAYNLGVTDPEQYLAQLKASVNTDFPVRYRKKLERSIDMYFPANPRQPAQPNALPKSIMDYKFIHQTDKKQDGGAMSRAWRDMNSVDGWKYVFYDDERANTWISRQLRGSEVAWAWQALRRGVLKADVFRYLVVLVQGGVYSDVDTLPLRPISEWGSIDAQLYDTSATDGLAWWRHVPADPSVVVGVDVDVHEYVNWNKNWPRPLGVCQWTLGGGPNHPIYIDAIRRVVNATRYIEHFISDIPRMIDELEKVTPPNWRKEVKQLQASAESGIGVLSVMEHTGPGIWTDAVLAYLKARYNVTWHELRGLQRPLRIGEVLILPITGFSPGGEPDFGAKGKHDPQAAVYHDFRGSWKIKGSE